MLAECSHVLVQTCQKAPGLAVNPGTGTAPSQLFLAVDMQILPLQLDSKYIQTAEETYRQVILPTF